MITKQKGLGRGLAALLGADTTTAPPMPETVDQSQHVLKIGQLRPGRYQPRTRMDETALQELAQSLISHGMMQPIVVRPLPLEPTPPSELRATGTETQAGAGTTLYEIIAGERRFRAARLAGLEEVPIIIRDVPDEQALALALIENIQREDLNPLEEAQAIKRLIDEFAYSHEQAAQAIGRSRSATSNLLRLLNLATTVQTMLIAGDLDMGHARALLPLDRATQTMIANEVVQKRLSVRETERLATKTLENEQSVTSLGESTKESSRKTTHPVDRDLLRIQESLCESLATEVRIQPGPKGAGKLVISFSSPENFEGLMDRLGVQWQDLA